MSEEEKKMLEMAKDISNYCNSQKCCSLDCAFCENSNLWCTLFRMPSRWAEHIEKKEDDAE